MAVKPVGFRRKRPISLEITPELPDDRVALGADQNKPEDKALDLNESIDALLQEVEATCAAVENPQAAKSARKKPAVDGSESTQESNAPAGDAEPSTPPHPATESGPEPEPESESESGSDAQVEAPDTAQDAELEADTEPNTRAEEALEALDVVEQKTQSLIEDTIDDLLDETDASDQADHAEPDGSQPADTLDEEAIDAQLDALDASPEVLDEADDPEAMSDSEDLLASIADELTAHDAEPSEPADPVDTAVDADADAEEPEPEAVESTAHSIPEDMLDDVLEDVLEEESAQSPHSEIEESPETINESATDQAMDAVSTLADLDASLADIGDELLMGDFETPDGERISSDSLNEGSDAAALLEQLGLDEITKHIDGAPQEPAPEPGPAADSAPAPIASVPAKPEPSEPQQRETRDVPQAANQTQPSTLRPSATEPTPTTFETEGEVESIWQTARRISYQRSNEAWRIAKAHAMPFAASTVLAINKPIRERPAQLRDSIGYLALWTLLLATILWVYLAFIRVTPTPTPTQAPTRMLEPGEIVDPLRTSAAP